MQPNAFTYHGTRIRVLVQKQTTGACCIVNPLCHEVQHALFPPFHAHTVHMLVKMMALCSKHGVSHSKETNLVLFFVASLKITIISSLLILFL